MVSKVTLKKEQFHRLFVESSRFAPELDRVPFRWRKRLLNVALGKMAWSSHYKIYEWIGRDVVREFVARYVPEHVNLAAGDDEICNLSEVAAAGVLAALGDVGARISMERLRRGEWGGIDDDETLNIVARECARYGIEPPKMEDVSALAVEMLGLMQRMASAGCSGAYIVEKLGEIIAICAACFAAVVARATDARWWRRQLRKTVGRARECGSIRLGMVHYRGEPYASNESVIGRIAQNRRNALALESVLMENEAGQQFTLAQLAEKGTSNKQIRRGELMLRINGFETIARECGDAGIFITWTCPSKYHARIKGGTGGGAENPKYAGLDPREANQYLGRVTALARSALARRGLALYGFRIAEPHHDGCPHWHMLLFVRATDKFKTPWITDLAGRVIRIMQRYAWREDRGESGAFKYRLDAKRIDWAKGSAAGYIAKYVAKNIDGAHVGEHKTLEGYNVQTDKEGEQYLTPSARVETWAACWGIRQFQQWGGAPVSIWRELRRIKKEMVQGAPDSMRKAWDAVQKIEGEKRADWAQYLKAQGGAIVPRKNLVITLAKDKKTVIGRYGESVQVVPYGVRCAHLAGVVYASVRHVWRQVEKVRGVAVAVGVAVAGAFAVPRTRVNNCTQGQDVEQSDTQRGGSAAVALPVWVFSDADRAQVREVLNACPYPRLIV